VDEAYMGDFIIDKTQLRGVGAIKTVELDDNMVDGISDDLLFTEEFERFVKIERSANFILCRVAEEAAQSVDSITKTYLARNTFYEGDVRISFTYTDPSQVSFIGQ